MAGGLLNLVAYGNRNIILNGNPSKTFFKTTYAKYTNFGLQKFRIDLQGKRELEENYPSVYDFTIPKYADLLMDTYFVITIPHIWSPIYIYNAVDYSCCQPYEFKWIENLGAQLIKKVTFTVAGKILQEFTGQYLQNMVQRDFMGAKKDLFNEMTGNVKQLNDPANYGGCNGNYPNFVARSSYSRGGEPSIRGRKLYIPFNVWFVLSSKLAFPLLCLQKNQLKIRVECRSIRELFVVRDMNYYINTFWHISDAAPGGMVPNPDISYSNPPYISTQNLVDPKYQMYLFLTQNIKDISNLIVNPEVMFMPTQQNNWNADIHLLSTYAFLDPEETRVFTRNSPMYLIKQVHETLIETVNTTSNWRSRFYTTGLVASWMWFFQRNDVNLRNEWSNYTNWPYKDIPFPCIPVYNANSNPYKSIYSTPCKPLCDASGIQATKSPYWPLINSQTYDPSYSYIYITGPRQNANKKYIMMDWSLICDGKLRENTLYSGVLSYIDKYIRTSGNSEPGLYCYNFCLTTDPFEYQPTGAMNMTHFQHIAFEYNTISPPSDLSSVFLAICDKSNNFLGYNNNVWMLSKYSYNLYVMEERYNIIKFEDNMVIQQFMQPY